MAEPVAEKPGRLLIAGCGLHPGHITAETVNAIGNAELVMVVAPNPLSIAHIQSLNPRVENLAKAYGEFVDRQNVYTTMAERIISTVRNGVDLCVVFYGHPAVFVDSTHIARRILLAEGYSVQMLPGISAEDCLFADLGVDPGESGCQSYEATQFLLNYHQLHTGAYLLLWQIGLTAAHLLRSLRLNGHGISAIVQLLKQWYPDDHLICVYEAATLPGQSPRTQWMPLSELKNAILQDWSTLVVPPLTPLVLAEERLAWLGIKADRVAELANFSQQWKERIHEEQ